MIRGTILILFLLIARSALCQDGSQQSYPRKIVVGKDTVIALTREQMQVANNLYLHLDECKEVCQQTSDALDSCKVALSLYDSTDKNLKSQNAILYSAIEERDTVISRATVLDRQNRDVIKKLKNQNILLKVSGVVAGIAIVLLSIL